MARTLADRETPVDDEQRRAYWRRNLRLIISLLVVWFVVSYGFGILLVETLNQWSILGMPLGFWFAQQGSIVTFVVLILIYALSMDRLDDEFGASQRDETGRRR
jgi:putative solute:sodium symporter small subunit